MFNLAKGKVILKLSNSVLVRKKSSSLYSNFILNLYIIYEYQSECNPSNNFALKNALLETVKLVRNTVESKFIYNGSGIAFDRKGSWSFRTDFARNVITFGVVDNSSSHANNKKK